MKAFTNSAMGMGLIALVACGLLTGCAVMRPPGNTGFDAVATLKDLEGTYQNAGEGAVGQPTVHLSSLVWPDYPGLDHSAIESIKVEALTESNLEVSAFGNGTVLRQDVFVEGTDFEFHAGRLRTGAGFSPAGAEPGDPLAGVYHTAIDFGIDKDGHGKYRSKLTAAGLVYLVVPIVAGESQEIRFVRLDGAPRASGKSSGRDRFPPAGCAPMLSVGWAIPTGSVSNLADTVYFEETDVDEIYDPGVAVALGITGWFYGMYAEGAIEGRWSSSLTDRGQRLANSSRDDGQEVQEGITSWEAAVGRYWATGSRTMVLGAVAAGQTVSSLYLDEGKERQTVSGFGMAGKVGLLRRWGHTRLWLRPIVRYQFLSKDLEIPHDLSFQLGVGFGVLERAAGSADSEPPR